MNKEIKTTERGWAGHFICSDLCYFRRNTLIEYRDIKIVINTVGALFSNGKVDMVGQNRYYETEAFHSNEEDTKYHNADITQKVDLGCKWAIDRFDEDTDNEANEMHDNAVKWVCEQLEKGFKL